MTIFLVFMALSGMFVWVGILVLFVLIYMENEL